MPHPLVSQQTPAAQERKDLLMMDLEEIDLHCLLDHEHDLGMECSEKSREQKDSFFGRSTSPSSSPPNINKNSYKNTVHNARKKDNCNKKDFPPSQQDVNKFLNKVIVEIFLQIFSKVF